MQQEPDSNQKIDDSGSPRLRDKVGSNRFVKQLSGDGLKAKALRGSGWTIAGFGSQQILRLGSNLVLTRLLFPEAFGLMALATVFMTGLQMFSDIGIRPSIIQNKRGDDPVFLNTAWTIGIIRGFILWAISCVIAYPVAMIYEEPILFPILCVVGSTAAIRGFQTTGYATSSRNLNIGKLSAVELSTRAIGITAMITWAWFFPNVWAIVCGGVVSSFLSVLIGHRVLNTHKHRICLNKESMHELMKFGKWIFLSSAITFLAQSGDKMLLPKILHIKELGFYSIAAMFMTIPVGLLKQIASKVLFPVYSQVMNRDGIERINEVTKRFALLSSPMFFAPLFLLLFGEWMISIMYDERYSATGPALSILAIGSFFEMMRAGQAGLLLAAGNSKASAIVNAARVTTGLPIAAFLSMTWGLDGFCVGIVIANATALTVQRFLARRTVPGLASGADQLLLLILLAALTIRIFMV